MNRTRLIHELNELLQRDYGMEHTIEDPITVHDLALIVLALKEGRQKKGDRQA
jgi:hypothetical protein